MFFQAVFGRIKGINKSPPGNCTPYTSPSGSRGRMNETARGNVQKTPNQNWLVLTARTSKCAANTCCRISWIRLLIEEQASASASARRVPARSRFPTPPPFVCRSHGLHFRRHESRQKYHDASDRRITTPSQANSICRHRYGR